MTGAMRIDGHAAWQISADDRGLAYGDGVFRTIRIANGRAVGWPFHYARLIHDCAALGFTAPAHEALAADINALCRDATSGVLKIMITRGSGGRGYVPPNHARPRRIVALHGAPPVLEICVLPISPVVLATPAPLAGIKHLNRLEQVLARQYCDRDNIADAAMCDSSGRIICTTMRNLIFVDEAGRWLTPDLSRAGVIGATRERLRTAIPELTACDITAADLDGVTAAIACNSVGGAVAVTRLGKRTFGDSTALAERANILLADSV